MVLSKEALLKAMELKTETVKIAGGKVIVSEIGAVDLMELYTRKELHNEAGDIVMAKFTAALVAMAVVDEKGARVFSDADIPLIEKGSAAQFAKLSEAARRLNGLTGEETKN